MSPTKGGSMGGPITLSMGISDFVIPRNRMIATAAGGFGTFAYKVAVFHLPSLYANIQIAGLHSAYGPVGTVMGTFFTPFTNPVENITTLAAQIGLGSALLTVIILNAVALQCFKTPQQTFEIQRPPQIQAKVLPVNDTLAVKVDNILPLIDHSNPNTLIWPPVIQTDLQPSIIQVPTPKSKPEPELPIAAKAEPLSENKPEQALLALPVKEEVVSTSTIGLKKGTTEVLSETSAPIKSDKTIVSPPFSPLNEDHFYNPADGCCGFLIFIEDLLQRFKESIRRMKEKNQLKAKQKADLKAQKNAEKEAQKQAKIAAKLAQKEAERMAKETKRLAKLRGKIS